uniref:ATP synthase subunit a n=2 Tax=Candida metapsilosis TaxID=273372 RepID=Q6TN90_9ASCO|nr:ATP synthase subunit 6 [Candida metapsilosis]AAR26265.2 ATP synthase subunit 6 [Candida metapsilosis]AAX73041.1 ATP synthase subunit 6 [Candida metapsilosis]AEX57357.1 ATP synthase subunit 6 [Candida metapsilosis]AEX57372.1 ATP synthase subunit 6 [Candida metapsilosis]AEX57387.1 ATP synthase subunit 6 [Candida metapsilosis]
MFYSPLDQFELKPLLLITDNLTFSITNYTLYLIIVSLIIMFYSSIIRNNFLGSSRWGVSVIAIYDTILNLVNGQIGRKGGYFFPLIFTIFNFILIANLISMIPYSFAISAQLVAVVSFSLALWIGNVVLGLYLHGWGFFALFVPSGTPLPLVPVLVLIEALSYASRAISLGLRLGANILSGHLLMLILGSLIIGLMSSSLFGFISGIIPILAVVAITILEFAIAIIQAYVFSILLSGYIKDSVDLH